MTTSTEPVKCLGGHAANTYMGRSQYVLVSFSRILTSAELDAFVAYAQQWVAPEKTPAGS